MGNPSIGFQYLRSARFARPRRSWIAVPSWGAPSRSSAKSGAQPSQAVWCPVASERWQVRRNQERSKRRGPNESEDSQESRTAVDSVGGIGGCENLTSDHGRRIKGLKATADGQHSDLSPLMAPKQPSVEIRRTVTILTHRVQAMLEAVNLTKRYDQAVALDASEPDRPAGRDLLSAGRQRRGEDDHDQPVPKLRRSPRQAPRASTVSTSRRTPLETKKYLAYIPETVMLYKNLTGLENLEYFSALAGRSDYTRAQLLEFLTQVGLQPGRSGQTRRHVFEGDAAEGRDRDCARQGRRRRSCSMSRPPVSIPKPRTSSPPS